MKSLFLSLFALVSAVFSGTAFAALPSGVAEGVATVKADGLAMADLVWPVIIALVGAVVLMKLFKRFINKI